MNAISFLSKAKDAFRGQGTDVSDCKNNPLAIMAKSTLNWRVGQTKVGAIGRTETREIPGYRANIRSDNGQTISIVTDSYRPHHNHELVGAMTTFADAAGMIVTRAGSFGGGTHVWAIADSTATGEVGVGDIYRLRIAMRSSHDGTSASMFRSWYERIRCLNGMVSMDSTGTIRFVHSSALTQAKADMVAAYMSNAEDGFRTYLAAMRRLRSTRSTPVIDRLIMLELVAPELLQVAHDRLHRISNTSPASSTPAADGASILGSVIQAASLRDDSLDVVQGLIDSSRSRTAKLLDAVIDTQVGGNLTRGSLAHVVNAVSAYQTHLRGEMESTNSLLFTPGQDMARSAMDVATTWANVIEASTR